jgi:spermidine synthase
VSELTLNRAGLSEDGRYFTDVWADGALFTLAVGETLLDEQSQFQRVQVLNTPRLGRLLVLDGHLQTSERDEHGYHELIVHPGLCRAGAPEGDRKVLIIGGGDGGAAREALRHEDVSRVDLVDIDAAVMDSARRFLPTIWRHPSKGGSLDQDARFNVYAEDGVAFIEDKKRGAPEYDHIVVDASDPVGPGTVLYSERFYAAVARRLSARGSVSVQAGSAHYLPEVLQTVFHGLKDHLPGVYAYECFTQIYPGGVWNLVMGTKAGDDPREVDLHRAGALEGCRFYDSSTHRAAFALPPVAREVLAQAPPDIEALSARVEALS